MFRIFHFNWRDLNRNTIKIVLLAGCMFMAIGGFGRTLVDGKDSPYPVVPDSLTTPAGIAAFLVQDLSSDEEKVTAIFNWIAGNIHYDVDLLQNENLVFNSEDVLDDVIQNRKGICMHYAELFYAMAKASGLKAYKIKGYTRNSAGNVIYIGHIWNAVKINGGLYLFDATWAAGYVERGQFVQEFSDRYFMVRPEVFIRTHMPFDPMWQLLPRPVSHKEFDANKFPEQPFASGDIIMDNFLLYAVSGELNRLRDAHQRILETLPQSGQAADLLHTELNNLAGIMYNMAVDDINHAVMVFNSYSSHKGKRFRDPVIEDFLIRQWTEELESRLSSAENIVYNLNSAGPELNNLIEGAIESLVHMRAVWDNETEFINRYLSTRKALRVFLF